MLDIPATVRAKARQEPGWLESLPGLVDELAVEWSFTPGRAYQDGTEAYVAEAVLVDGTPAVLKLLVPRAGGTHAAAEITVLRLAGGDGCVRLLRSDAARGAMLLERLGPSLADLDLPLDERLEILCDLAQRVWRPAPDSGLPTGAEKGRWLVEHIRQRWEDLDRPCSERTVAHAIACAERRIAAHDDARAMLVHGDVHQWNALRAGDGYKLVDPDGLLAEPEYDLGVLMREDPVELMQSDPWDRAHLLAERTRTDATAIWEWGVTERVSTGLLAVDIGLQPVGDQMLAAAELISVSAA
ncbi:aminoglycoside phosphotransferase family protein [Actinoplanes friuliensis]|uniref:Aminoglycoside/hydroxyurea antibiotic resistance kinase n=1 Tax=Actinoplanes friuliensis DSM 7358 TaxID=1246995 RepID=U5W2N7_9ACTN|nr:aminoglycoside phosphotransferase family protein [Actinoplanes friuliensis]AGZ43277.1 aminoglycoside/hydroxyurea antibiotic resistance kinase [Actinoplanes friuliensis DSM 7358]